MDFIIFCIDSKSKHNTNMYKIVFLDKQVVGHTDADHIDIRKMY